MFCSECGIELMNGVKFCSKCGTPIIFDSFPSTKIAVDEAVNLYENRIVIPETLNEYINIRANFEGFAKKSQNQFVSDLSSKYTDLDSFMKHADKDVEYYCDGAVDLILSELNTRGVFQYSRKDLSIKVSEYISGWGAAYNEIAEAYENITGYQVTVSKYLDLRKELRGKVIGGGIGVSGAIKGMAIAGSFNLLTGTLHSISNYFELAGARAEATKRKNAIYRDKLIQQSLSTILYEDVFNLHMLFLELYNETAPSKIYSYNLASRDKADNIYKYLSENDTKPARRRELMVEMLEFYPFEQKYYQMAIRYFPEDIDDLRNFAKMFQVSIDEIHKKYCDILRYNTIELLGNPLYGKLQGVLTSDIEHNILMLKKYMKSNSIIFGEVLVGDGINPEMIKFLERAQKTYAVFEDEKPLFIYSYSYGKEGLLITDKGVYGYYLDRINKRIDEILNVDIIEGNLYIEDFKMIIWTKMVTDPKLCGDIVKFIIAMVNICNNRASGSDHIVSEQNNITLNSTKDIDHVSIMNDKNIEVKSEISNEGEDEYEKLLSMLEDIDEKYLHRFEKYSEFEKYFFTILEDNEKNFTRCDNAIQTYVPKILKDEIPILIYDDTYTQTGRTGFVFTNYALHYSYSKATGSVPLDMIDTLEYKMCGLSSGLMINKSISISTKLMGVRATQELVDVFPNIKAYVKKR